jgi:hypothetical protein
VEVSGSSKTSFCQYGLERSDRERFNQSQTSRSVKAANETSNSEDDDDHWPTLAFDLVFSVSGQDKGFVVNGILDDLRILYI